VLTLAVNQMPRGVSTRNLTRRREVRGVTWRRFVLSVGPSATVTACLFLPAPAGVAAPGAPAREASRAIRRPSTGLPGWP